MSFAQLQYGAESAPPLPLASRCDANEPVSVGTTGDLLAILRKNPTRSFKMIRTVCGHLGNYLDLPGDQIPIDLIERRKRGFRPFLEGRRYTEHSVRTYMNHQRKLLKAAMLYGWRPQGNPAEAWNPLLDIAAEKGIKDVVWHFACLTTTPREVTKEMVDLWGQSRIADGLMYTTVATKRNRFWRLLEKTGWVTKTPVHLLKFRLYGIPLEEMPHQLREDIQIVLRWKQAEFARNRPKYGRIRAVTAKNIRLILQQVTGYVINVVGGHPQSLRELIVQDNIEGFVEWAINERHVMGVSIQGRLAGVLAIVKYHPMFAGLDFSWFKTLLDSIPIEDASERKKRKALKYLTYEELEAIPSRIRAYRQAYELKRHKNPVKVAQLAMEELIFRWFLVFPWRQRNLRECTIGGPAPNLFKARIPPITEIDKPRWIEEEEAKNPAAEFWQISFDPDGTKTHIAVDLFVARQLVEPLEEYLSRYRPLLVKGNDPGTLFSTPRGRRMRSDQVGKVIGHWTTVFAPKRTTPHLIRDAIAHRWLKSHPKDYLTLSKLLWHKNIQTTIGIYASRFNESSGLCAMEAWLEGRGGIQ